MTFKLLAVGAALAVFAFAFAWNVVESLKYKWRYGFMANGQDDLRPFYLLVASGFVGFILAVFLK